MSHKLHRVIFLNFAGIISNQVEETDSDGYIKKKRMTGTAIKTLSMLAKF